MKVNIKLGILLIMGFLISSCIQTISFPSLPMRINTSPQTSTNTNTLSPTPTASPTITITPTNTNSVTATHIFTQTTSSINYLFPVQPAELAKFSRGHHDYPAIDIFVPVGSEFVAVTNGVVDYVRYVDTWNPKNDDPTLRGGLCVAIIGDDGLRYYGSHLSAIARGIVPGARVSVGQLLGFTGLTGNARTTPAHLHFGISHPTYPEDWLVRRGEVDPYPYLIAWLNGQDITPVLATQTPAP